MISLERGLEFGRDQQRRTQPAQARHLQITRVLTDVRIEERTFFMRLFETTAGDNVIEDHRDAQRAKLHRRISFVLDSEPQNQMAILDQP